ncbi:MAG TPA: hypothetical protein EYP10_02580, partial [Armatimonadetes bacterium]|nr:hypothetical protein [Armatimonadota bacterium]
MFAPHTFHEIWRPDELAHVRETFRTFIYADRWGRQFKLGRDLLLNTFVSDGPKIERFSVSEPGEWMALDERLVKVSFRITSDAPLRTVKLYFGGKLIRCYRPNVKAFEATAHYVTNESQAFYLVAEDAHGHRAFSKGLPAGRVHYHHFIGGDRMNGYWWGAEPTLPHRANHKVAGKWVSILGSLYPGLGWGDRIHVRNLNQLDHPYGLEVGQPTGGIRTLNLSPLLHADGLREFLLAAPYRTFPLNSTDCVLMDDEISHEREHFEERGYLRKRIVKAKLIHATVRTIGFRWRRAIMLLIESRVKFLRDIKRVSDKNLALALVRVLCDDVVEAYRRAVYTSRTGALVENPGVVVEEPTELRKGGFVCVYPNPFGVPALFAF